MAQDSLQWGAVGFYRMQEISWLAKDLLAAPWISYLVSQKKNGALSHLSLRMAKVTCILPVESNVLLQYGKNVCQTFPILPEMEPLFATQE